VSIGEVLVFTALSAAAVAVVRVWASRGARQMVARSREHKRAEEVAAAS
jgi:hypothetical protein